MYIYIIIYNYLIRYPFEILFYTLYSALEFNMKNVLLLSFQSSKNFKKNFLFNSVFFHNVFTFWRINISVNVNTIGENEY